MKRICYPLFSFLTLLACNKKDVKPQYGDAIFYTLNPYADKTYSVIVDDVYKGLLPYTLIVPFCENNPGILGLRVTLTTGIHTVRYHKIPDGYAGVPDKIKQIVISVDKCQPVE